MKESNSENNSIVKADSSNLIRVNNAIQITNKLLFSEVEKLFNEGFYLLNSRDIKKEHENFFFKFMNDPNFLLNHGFWLYANNEDDYRKAEQHFSKIIKKRSDLAIVYNFLGVAERRLGKYELAISNFNKALEIDPKYVNAFLHRTLSKKKCHLPHQHEVACQKAIEGINKVLELAPNYIMAYYHRGYLNSYFGLRNYDKAQKDFTKAISLQLNFSEAYYERGNVHFRTQNDKEALLDYNRAIEIDSNNAEYFFKRSLIYRQASNHDLAVKDIKRAIKDLERAIMLKPDDPKFYRRLGNIYAKDQKVKDLNKALLNLSKAIEVEPKDADHYYTRANFYLNLYRFNLDRNPAHLKSAITDYNKTLEFTKAPHLIRRSYNERGQAKKKLGDINGAKKDFQKLRELKSGAN